MATLHMDVELTQKLVNDIRGNCEEFQRLYVNLSNHVSEIIGTAWISPAANEFLSDFELTSMQFRTTIDRLEELSLRLADETQNWMETSQLS